MTPYVRRGILAGLKSAFLLMLGAWVFAIGQPEPLPGFREVWVTKEAFNRTKPDTIIKWKERIVYRTVKAEQIAVAPGAGAEVVEKFCAPVEPRDSADSRLPSSSTVAPLPMLFDAGSFDGKRLKLYEVRANGDAAVENFRVRAPFTFAVKDGRALVQGQRLWWVDDALKIGAVFGAGYLTGRVVQ